MIKLTKEEKIKVLNLAIDNRSRRILRFNDLSGYDSLGLCFAVHHAMRELIPKYKKKTDLLLSDDESVYCHDNKGKSYLFKYIPELLNVCIKYNADLDYYYFWENIIYDNDLKNDIRLKVLRETIKVIKNESTIK